MNHDFNHDRFVHKNRSLAGAVSIEKHDTAMEKKGFSRHDRQEDASCFNCKNKMKCAEFRVRRSGGTTGAVSFGGTESFLCDRYQPAPAQNRSMSDRQIRSLLKNVKKGRI